MEHEKEQRLRADLDARIASLRLIANTIIDSHPEPERALAALEQVAAHLATLLDDGADASPTQRARARAFVAELQELKRFLERTKDGRATIARRKEQERAAVRPVRPHRQQDQGHDRDR